MPKEIPGQHYEGQVTQKAVITKNNQVLIVRDIIDTDTWDLPGGRLHKTENMSEGLEREVREEIGISVIVGPVIYTDQFIRERDGIPNVIIAHQCTLTDKTAVLTLAPDEIAEAKWITKEELATIKMYAVCKRALEVYFTGL